MPLETALSVALQKPTTAYGFWLTFPSAPVAKTLLRTTSKHPSGGFSWVLIDAEHGLISDKDYYELTNAVAAEGASPLIRIPWSEEWMIKRALDGGAHGIVTPMCHSADDAKRIVGYSKYPPLGTRGYGPLFTPHSFPGLMGGAAYDNEADEGLFVIVQIESRQGVESVEEIAKVEGVDALLIGPFDLAKMMGVVRGGDEHEAAIQRVLKAAKAAGKKIAIFCTGAADAKRRAEQGFDMVSIIADVTLFAEAVGRELTLTTGAEETGEAKPRTGY